MSHTAGERSTVPEEGQLGTSGWVGWIAFAGVMLFMLGTFQVIQGTVALVKEDYFVVSSRGMVLDVSFTTWGWIHVVTGIIVVLAGVGVLAGQVWARIVGTLIAALSAIVSVVFMVAAPLWSLAMITIAVVVIMALTVHGSEIKSSR